MISGHDFQVVRLENASTEHLFLNSLEVKKISADVLRLDKIHPVISGNKWFKLKYYLEDALAKKFGAVVTFGGAWSNHIIATACFARQLNLQSVGIIRGEEPREPSETLLQARRYGMDLRFISRRSYAVADPDETLNQLGLPQSDAYLIPSGGAGEFGVNGSMEMLSLTDYQAYSHILCSVGTGTMFTGIINASADGQEIIGLPAIKGITSVDNILQSPIATAKRASCKIMTDYHFGGYGKKSAELLHFMNEFYNRTGIPTDFVYTGKLFFGCLDMVQKDYFPPGSKLLIIHSGGLQGNASLPAGTLVF